MDRNKLPNFDNKIFSMIMKSPRGLDLLTNVCRATVSQAKSDKKFYHVWAETGLSCFVAPIFLDNSFSGIVLATSFFTEKTSEKDKEKLYKVLRDFGYTSKEIDAGLGNTKTILKDQLVYFDELVELVGSEIETLHEEISSRENKISQLNKELGTRYRYDNMIGKSSVMQDLYNLLDKIKHSTSTVLIQGDNGTGKELIAKAIHYNSPRKDKVFVVQNCSAFNDNLLESELFGHVKGSFTGAVKDKKGLFEEADGGVIFLDEIGEASQNIQTKLLTYLDHFNVSPRGWKGDPFYCPILIVAATNQNLKERGIRPELINRFTDTITIPPLRERMQDLELILDCLLQRESMNPKQFIREIGKEALDSLRKMSFKEGNFRELENLFREACKRARCQNRAYLVKSDFEPATKPT